MHGRRPTETASVPRTSNGLRSVGVCLLVLASALRCGNGNRAGICVPGQAVACVGVAACAGTQVCNADGAGYSPCQCGQTGSAGTNGGGAGASGGVGGVGGRGSGGLAGAAAGGVGASGGTGGVGPMGGRGGSAAGTSGHAGGTGGAAGTEGGGGSAGSSIAGRGDAGGSAGSPPGGASGSAGSAGGPLFAVAARYSNFMPNAFCDADGDGRPDAVWSRGSSDTYVWKGHGDGTFDSTPTVTQGLNSDGAVTGDVDGDGKCDLVTFSPSGQTINALVSRGQADATFKAPTGFSGASWSTSSTLRYIGDLNRDGRLDIVVVQQNAQGFIEYSAALGQPVSGGQSAFFMSALSVEGFVATPAQAFGVRLIGDVDGDGNPDIAVPLQVANAAVIAIAYGTGDGHFKTSAAPNIVSQANGMIPAGLADFDHDGRADLVAYNGFNSPADQIFWSEGGGNFTPGPSLWFSDVGDFDADGALDVFANYSWEAVRAWASSISTMVRGCSAVIRTR